MRDTPSPSPSHFVTQGGLSVNRTVERCTQQDAFEALAGQIDSRRGLILSSGVDVPGRYTRFDLGFSDPPLFFEIVGRKFRIGPLNARGRVLAVFFQHVLEAMPGIKLDGSGLAGTVDDRPEPESEEHRTRHSGVFQLLRALIESLHAPDESVLGLYGAFGYDLVQQLDAVKLRLDRSADQRDLLLYLPDRIYLRDIGSGMVAHHSYEFAWQQHSTAGLDRDTPEATYNAVPRSARNDHAPGEYQATVEKARSAFFRGDLFEAVPTQLLCEPYAGRPSEAFLKLRNRNPAPFGALLNLGDGEFLVSASPEMFVRSDGRMIESCPISGTISRGRDALEDAENIRKLLNSSKDEYELNMCTDVDRNDKARVCEPGSVRVVGRRQIELYSRLIHTVDHVEGRLRPDMDALDGFLSHAWAVTVTGAPKLWAIQFLEDTEKSPRRWYGGAIGGLMCDGSLNTGLTIRTIRLHDGVAEIRVGATLLYDSVPAEEEAECALKASALLAVLRNDPGDLIAPASIPLPKLKRRILVVDCEDSFVHMLADYFRQIGAEVTVVRRSQADQALDCIVPDLVVLSPGPGRPADFALLDLIQKLAAQRVPTFGVCLGMQALAEFAGGRLGTLDTPVHGRPSSVHFSDEGLFASIGHAQVGRYHSLYVRPETCPGNVRLTAFSDDGVPMALEFTDLPFAAVQFHPESIISEGSAVGLQIAAAALTMSRPM